MKNTDLIAVAKPEFKVGDFITYNHGIADDRIYKIVEDHVVHGFVVASSGDREFWTMFVGEFVKATPAEIKAGHRIDRALTSDSDDVSDIAYHVSTLTKVQCHHQWIGADVLGDTEHQYFCTYCGEKKTEAFGVKHESN